MGEWVGGWMKGSLEKKRNQFSPGVSGRNTALDNILTLVPRDSFPNFSNLLNCKIMTLCCFKALSVNVLQQQLKTNTALDV